jgi:hypothetical protein
VDPWARFGSGGWLWNFEALNYVEKTAKERLNGSNIPTRDENSWR